MEFLIISTCIIIYFAPALMATEKRNFAAIAALNLFAGWTFIGWIAALVWALTKETPKNETNNKSN